MAPVRNGSSRVAALALGLTVVASGAGPAVAAGAARRAPALAGTTTITGSTAGYVNVRLAAPATLDNAPFGRGSLTVRSAGQWAGFFLTDGKRGGVRLLGGRAKDSARGPYLMPLAGVRSGTALRLPAGSYRLYLLTDGARATVTLRLGGRTGRTALTPAHRVPFTLRTPAADVAAPGGGNVLVAGAEGTLRGPGVAFDYLRTVNSNFQASNTQFCFYAQRPPAGPLAYAPGCPQAQVAPVLTVLAPGTGRSEGGAYGASADLPAGTYGQGFNFVSVAVAEQFRYSAGFFSYE